MPSRHVSALVGAGAVLALALLIGGCTAGGQFDPTEVLSSDVLGTKKKIPGDREPLFPAGVPGAETGVPPDLVKGYQPPPEQAADAEAVAKPAPEPAAAKPKPKPKPKPKVANTPAQPKPAPGQAAWPPPQQGAPQSNWPAPQSAPAQANWPAPPAAGQAQQGAQPNWPAPPAPSSH
jgi:hypothetical protein